MCAEQRRTAAVAATLWALVAGLIAIYLVLFVLGAAGRLVRPLDEFTYGESWLLDGARRVAQGEWLYTAPDHIPIMHIAYTPLYYIVVGGLQRVVGDSGYLAGRLVSLVAILVGAAALAWSLERLSSRRSVGLLGAGLFLTQNLTTLLWAPMHRVDPLAVGLTLVGLALATDGRIGLAAVVFVLAWLTKQTYVIAPLAVALALWPCRQCLVRFGLVFLGGLVLSVGLAQWLSGGWFFWHTVTANTNERDLITFSALMGSFLQYNGLPLLAALASFTLPARPGERLWRIYFVACIVELAGLAKLGASSNYWLELTAAIAALLALGAHHLAAVPAARLIGPTVVAGSLLVALPAYQATAVEVAANVGELIRPSWPPYLSLVGDGGFAPIRVERAFVDRLAREPGELLTDNSGLAAAAGKRVEFEFQIFQLLHAEGYWAEQPIIDAVNARRFSLVALMHPLEGSVDGTRWTHGLRAALRAAYAPAGYQEGFWLYRPRT